jgi:hypothetical protein
MNTQSLAVKADYVANVDNAVMAATADRRAPNCRGFLYDATGMVVGINLVHVPVPSAPYELLLAELIDEYASQGNTVVTVVVLNKDGVQTAERAFMAWPFPALDAGESPVGAGNPSNQFAATSPFPSNVIGPLAFHVGDKDGNVLSEIIGGYGLPDRHHIGGRVTFRERSAIVIPPDPDPDPNPVPDSVALTRIAVSLERLTEHLGA